MMSGPAIAVNPPKAFKNVFTGSGNFWKNLIIESTTFRTDVLILKNCSPADARSA